MARPQASREELHVPRLLLVDNTGAGEVVDAADLIREIDQLRMPPRLIVLASCQSAGPARLPRDTGALPGNVDDFSGGQSIHQIVAGRTVDPVDVESVVWHHSGPCGSRFRS